MNCQSVENQIVKWLTHYVNQSKLKGFIIGISGGIDSAVTSLLCAKTKKKVILVNLPIRQTSEEYNRAVEHIKHLESVFPNVTGMEINLTSIFDLFEQKIPLKSAAHDLAMANSRSRLRMMTLYAIAQSEDCLVAGTGNKIEDFGVGFFTKYGDGGVDLSPIADLTKSEIFEMAKHLRVVQSIQKAKPTDGLWDDSRSDEEQLGASYTELEWAMNFKGNDVSFLSAREKEVLKIFHSFHDKNRHKMDPIPVCLIPNEIKS